MLRGPTRDCNANADVFECLYSIETLAPLLEQEDNDVKLLTEELLDLLVSENGSSAARRFHLAVGAVGPESKE